MSLAYLNGHYQPLAETKISALDRGFLFGDGIYEVIPVYSQDNYLLRGREHLTRLDNSLRAIGMTPPLNHQQWYEIFETLLAEKHEDTCSIYLQITRGAETIRGHLFPNPPVKPTVFAFVNHLQIKSQAELAHGLKVITHQDIRWNNCFIKAITLLPNLLLMQQAKSQGFDEVILSRGDTITEACSSNVFIIKDGIVTTPPKSDNILGGITRELVLEILAKEKIPHREAEITQQQLFNADEVWLTSSTKEIAPVIEIDKKIIGNGKPGPLWQQAYQHYQAYLQMELSK